MPLRRSTSTLLLLLALGVAGGMVRAWGSEPPVDEELPASAWDEPPEPAAPEPPPVDDRHETFVVHTLFVDAVTRAPVPGVTVRLYPEVPHPEASFGTPMGTAVSGADGRALLRHDQLDAAVVDLYGRPQIAIVEAPGYAVLGKQQSL